MFFDRIGRIFRIEEEDLAQSRLALEEQTINHERGEKGKKKFYHRAREEHRGVRLAALP